MMTHFGTWLKRILWSVGIFVGVLLTAGFVIKTYYFDWVLDQVYSSERLAKQTRIVISCAQKHEGHLRPNGGDATGAPREFVEAVLAPQKNALLLMYHEKDRLFILVDVGGTGFVNYVYTSKNDKIIDEQSRDESSATPSPWSAQVRLMQGNALKILSDACSANSA